MYLNIYPPYNNGFIIFITTNIMIFMKVQKNPEMFRAYLIIEYQSFLID